MRRTNRSRSRSNTSGKSGHRTISQASQANSTVQQQQYAFVRYSEHDDEQMTFLQDLPSFLGIEEIKTSHLWRSAVLEFLGTAVMMYIHISIIVTASFSTDPSTCIAITHGTVLALFILAFASTSGGHFNPLISLGCVCARLMTIVRGTIYTLSQTLGAYAGALVFRCSVSRDTATTYMLGACNAGELGSKGCVISECMYGLCVLLIGFGVGLNPKQGQIFGPVLAPFLIGTVLALVIWVSANINGIEHGQYTGTAVNPAACQGLKWAALSHPQLGDAESISPTWYYWLGCICAVLLHTVVFMVAPPTGVPQMIQDDDDEKQSDSSMAAYNLLNEPDDDEDRGASRASQS